MRIPGAFRWGNSLNNDNTGFFTKSVNVTKAGGYIGIVTSIMAYYFGLAELLHPGDIFTLPTGKRNARRD